MLAWTFCVLLGSSAVRADSGEPDSDRLQIDAREVESSYLLGHFVQYQQAAPDVLVPDESAWTPSSSALLNLGFSQQAHWIRVRFDVTDEPEHGASWMLSLGTGNARIVDMHHRIDGRDLAMHRSGSGLPFDSRLVRYRKLTFPVQMIPGSHEVLLRIESHSSVSIEPTLSSRTHWLTHAMTDELVTGAWLGLIAILVFYNLFVAIRVRDPVFGYFGLTLTGALSWLMAETGVSPQYFYPDNPGINDFVLRASLGGLLAGLLLCSRSFLFVPRWSPPLAKLLFVAGCGIAVVFLFPLFRHFPVAGIVLVVGSMGLNLWAGVRAVRARIEGARAYLGGLLLLTGGAAIVAAKHNGMSLESALVDHAFEVAAFGLGFLGSLVLSSRLREARAAQVQALDESAAKSSFLANMSHEIRTPLNAIVGFTDLMRTTHLQPEQKSFLDRIQVASRHLLELVNDVLDFSKMEAGKISLGSEPLRLDDLLDEIREVYGARAEQQGLVFTMHTGEGVREGYLGDRLRLSQILANLVGNALKFTSKGEIEVRVESAGEIRDGDRIIADLVFTVRDTGIGMTEAQTRKLFKPFTQADASTTRQYGGTGLGLAICKQLVELMGGTLQLESEAGLGSTFRFTVPMPVDEQSRARSVDRAAYQNGSESTLAAQLAGLKVLLVEDNATNQLLAKTMLMKCGVACTVANHGGEALNLLEYDQFDAILMDCQMPVMDGYATTRAIRGDERWRDVPIIAMTANAMAGDRERCLEAGMNDYVAKPVRMHDVVSVLIAWTRDRIRREPLQSRDRKQAVSM